MTSWDDHWESVGALLALHERGTKGSGERTRQTQVLGSQLNAKMATSHSIAEQYHLVE